MKKIIVMAAFLAATVFSISSSFCEAKDVWVDRWQNINADIYVMDETIEYEENLDGKFFNVTTKEVQNGKLKRIVRWKFVKVEQEMWRYETNQMDGSHMTVVSPGYRIPSSTYSKLCRSIILPLSSFQTVWLSVV